MSVERVEFNEEKNAFIYYREDGSVNVVGADDFSDKAKEAMKALIESLHHLRDRYNLLHDDLEACRAVLRDNNAAGTKD